MPINDISTPTAFPDDIHYIGETVTLKRANKIYDNYTGERKFTFQSDEEIVAAFYEASASSTLVKEGKARQGDYIAYVKPEENVKKGDHLIIRSEEYIVKDFPLRKGVFDILTYDILIMNKSSEQ